MANLLILLYPTDVSEDSFELIFEEDRENDPLSFQGKSSLLFEQNFAWREK
jgi:hypothetical protein